MVQRPEPGARYRSRWHRSTTSCRFSDRARSDRVASRRESSGACARRRPSGSSHRRGPLHAVARHTLPTQSGPVGQSPPTEHIAPRRRLNVAVTEVAAVTVRLHAGSAGGRHASAR
jgi:hypothetical protein